MMESGKSLGFDAICPLPKVCNEFQSLPQILLIRPILPCIRKACLGTTYLFGGYWKR